MSEILVALCSNDGRYRPYRLFFPEFHSTSPSKLLLTKGSITSFYRPISSRVSPDKHSCSHCHTLNIQPAATLKMQRQRISNISANMSFENFTTVAVNITVSWYVTPCSFVHSYRRSALTHYFIHQGTINSSMKLEAVTCSETLVRLIQTTRPDIQKRVVSIKAAPRFSFTRSKF